jgi:hypothetical protein
MVDSYDLSGTFLDTKLEDREYINRSSKKSKQGFVVGKVHIWVEIVGQGFHEAAWR